jgi:DNA repair exonuclease SbcCD ATPase subunit
MAKMHTKFLEEQLAKKIALMNKQKEDTEKYIKEIEALGLRPAFNKEEYEMLKEKISSLERYEKYLATVSGNVSLRQELMYDVEKNKQLIEVERGLQAGVENKIAEYSEKIKEYTEVTKKLSELTDQRQKLGIEIVELKQKLAISEKVSEDIKVAKKEIEAIEKKNVALQDEFDSLAAVKDAFSQTGIKSVVIDYIIPRLEDKINNILGQLSDFKVLLSTTRDGANKNVVEGLFISIKNELGEEFDFTNYSGGERLKVIVAISEALSELQNVGFRILDELFIGLDEDSIEGFSSIMAKLYDRFNQMICISHLRTIKDMFDDRITVLKNNGTSFVE